MTQPESTDGRAGSFAIIESPTVTAVRDRPSRGSALVAWLALLLALAATGLLLWQMFGPAGQSASQASVDHVPAAAFAEQVAQQTAATETVTGAVDSLAKTQSTLAQSLQEQSARLARLEDRMPGLLAEIEAAQATQQEILGENKQLSAVLGRQLADNAGQVLLDVERLLAQASSALATSADLQGPVNLVIAAQQRVESANAPALADLLTALQADREQLQRAGERSILQASDDLQRLASGLDGMRMQGQTGGVAGSTEGGIATGAAAKAADSAASGGETTAAAQTETKWWQRLVKSSTDLVALPDQSSDQSLVRVTEVGRHDLNMMPPSARYLVLQNLRLRLLSARLALLMHDRTGFAADLKRSQQWFDEHFDKTDPQVAQALETLRGLEAMGEAGGVITLERSRKALEQARQAQPASGEERS